MADLELLRVAIGDSGAFGVLLQERIPFDVSLERTYPVNGQMVKIPPGIYRCMRTMFENGGYFTFEITGVQGHSRLLFHKGNVEEDSEGCVLVARRFGTLGGKKAVLDSAGGFADFMARFASRDEFDLEVRNA